MRKAFKEYTEPFRKYGDMMIFKINHAYRVSSLCGRLAQKTGLTKEEVKLLEEGGLLHDIGRFEQWKEYGDHQDAKTIDHGDYGVELLKKDNFIDKFTKNNHETIYTIVKYHNKYSVPSTLPDNIKTYLDIVRDADKIDVLYAMVIDELVCDDNNKEITDVVMEQARNKVLIRNKDAKTPYDWIAVNLAFIFDLKIKESFNVVKENDYHNKIIDKYMNKTSNKETQKQLEELRELVNNYIEERLTC